jgi:type I restriction enzyme S subunit
MGDVLYGKMRPYLNKVWVAEFDGLCSAEFLVFPKTDGVSSQFLAARLNAEDFVTFANGQVSGERPRVDFKKLSHFSILLPPIAEQERIVNKLEAALSGVERAEKATRRARERLHRYHAAVLHAAVTGELTQAWRKSLRKKENGNVKDGASLLQRLLVTRRESWEDAEFKRLNSVGKVVNDNKWKSRYPEPKLPNTQELVELPEGWVWASIDQLTVLVTSGSRGWKAYYSKDGALFIRSQDISTDRLNLSEVAHVRPPENSEGIRTQVRRDDLLITITGANVGKAALIDVEVPEAYVSQHVGLIRFADTRLVPFAYIYITSPEDGRRHLLASAYGAGKPGLNLEILRQLAIPLPPLAEQTKITNEVHGRLRAADKLAKALEQQLNRARATRESLLRESFAGHLVPQNHKDEPASELLERIRTKRKIEAQKPKGRPMPKSKSKVTRRPLLDVLREHKNPMTPEQLFRDAGFEPSQVDLFYRELVSLRDKLKEHKPKSSEAKSWPNRTHVFLELKES